MTILNMVGGGKNPYQPFHLDGISDLAVVGGDTEATITWTDPSNLVVDGQTLATWSSTKLVRKTGSAPTDSSDGTLVVTETVADTYSVSGYTDTGLTNGTTYYYGAFAVADNGLETISNTESVTPAQGGWQPGNNTLVYYKINDNDTNSTIYDLSGNNIDQTWSGTATYTTDATYGRVASFDGNSYTSAGSRVNFGNEVTFIALCNFDTIISGGRVLISQGQSSSTWATGIGEGIFGNGMYATFCAGGTPNQVESGINPTEGIWYMISGTRASDGTGKIYINGELKNTVTGLTTPTYNSGSNLRIGNRGDNTNRFHGLFKLFIGEDRCWTDQEIADLASEYGFTVS